MDSALIIFSRSPYGHINIIEASRVAQGLLVLDKTVACVFIGDGVISLLKNQEPAGIGVNSVKLALKYLVDAGVDFYALKDSLIERGLTEEMLDKEYNIKVIGIDELTSLQDKFETSIFF
ncbi:MAG: DsrE family protein [Candidatus Odinarchaeum yellowstonii]|uniref:DsrE family protein n=1 Tax=Odinarchaeota yellowstonii (strain LCB_4) TaxID=1841599 RepID=A0AAF0IBL1_ODILC|nr:MAG: DsrE family protein [Candidatus Odinarchaeum yellowstonii]